MDATVASPRGFRFPGLRAPAISSTLAKAGARLATMAEVMAGTVLAPGADEQASGAGALVQDGDAGDELAGIGEVEVVRAAVQARLRHAVVTLLVRAGSVDDDPGAGEGIPERGRHRRNRRIGIRR